MRIKIALSLFFFSATVGAQGFMQGQQQMMQPQMQQYPNQFAPGPQSGAMTPGGMIANTLPITGEQPAFAQNGGAHCVGDRYGNTRLVNQGGMPGPVQGGQHYQ